MSEQKSNTIWIKAYLPEGHQVGITFAFDSLDALPSASEVQAAIESKGYVLQVAGAEPGEELETMTHVLRRTHINKDDNSQTPVIAFYHENPKLKHKYDHVYMNTPEQIEQFERLSGMKLAAIPEYEGDTYIDRTHAKAGKYIVPMPNPIKVAAKEKPYVFGDKEGTTMKIQRLIDTKPANVTDLPQPEPFTEESAQLFSDHWKSQGFTPNQVLEILKVNRLGAWKHGVEAANERMRGAREARKAELNA